MLSGQVDLMPGHTSTVRITLSPTVQLQLASDPRKDMILIKDIPTLKEQGVDLVYPTATLLPLPWQIPLMT